MDVDGQMGQGKGDRAVWPELPLEAWQDTYTTLHLWTQIVGKLRLALAPMQNHWWQVPLYVTTRGLTTSPIPYQHQSFEMIFDFLSHQLRIESSDGARRAIALRPQSVADFFREIMAQLHELGIAVDIWPVPVEVEDRTPFPQDHVHAAYDVGYARRHWEVLVQVDRVFKAFQSSFIGKASPIQFYWGSFDLIETRFSGRRAPDHPGSPNVGRHVMREAFSHEQSACGFWAGAGLGWPAFYAFAYPEPPDYQVYPVEPPEAYYDPKLREFILPYETVRTAASPDATLHAFLQSTYEAAANLAHWDRRSLER
jgi:hypothetical protein